MTVEDGLSGCLSRVNANIETRHGPILELDLRFHLMKECVRGIDFRLVELEEIRHMPLGNDKRVEFRNREFIPDCEAKRI